MILSNPSPKFYQKLPTNIRYVFTILAVIIAVGIIVLSIGRVSSSPINIHHADKFAHGFAYFCLGFAVLPAMGKLRMVVVWGVLTLCGIGVEIMQLTMGQGRQGDIFDAVANSTGVLLAAIFWLSVSKLMAKT